MGYGYGGHMMYGYGGWLLWLIIVILAGLVIYYLVQQQKRNAASPRAGDSALEILRQRYARGEISKEQFDSMRKDLLDLP